MRSESGSWSDFAEYGSGRSLWVGGPRKVDLKICVKTLMGNEFGEVGIFFSTNQLPPVF